MSSFRPHHQASRPPSRRRAGRRRRTALLAALASGAIAIGVTIGLAITGEPAGDTAATPGGGHEHPDGDLPPGYRLTGEVGPMGGQVLETPGTRGGSASAGGVVVTDGADIDMGHIPLAYAVVPTWHLRNSGSEPVTLGQPKVTVVKGCCPSDPVLGTTTLAPGAETTLAFPTQMHEGMDGDHLFRLSVPVSGAGEPLVVSVAANFS